ncbi:alpha/beta hydrolase [Streptomyces sp. JNUCC 64]
MRRGVVPLLAVGALGALVPASATASTAATASVSANASTSATASANTATATAATAPGASAASLARFTGQRADWKPCGHRDIPDTARCATLKVPLDYRDPTGRTIDIEVSRSKATGPDDQRIGALFFNSGGPGGAAIDFPYNRDLTLPKEVGQRYDFIGIDPRGVGRSSPVSCGLKPGERQTHTPYKPSTFGNDVATAKRVADKCRAKYGDALGQFTTRNTARDMDVVRAVLKEPKVHYLGYSYGTYLGAVYTQLFPQRSGRVVLDSAIDPALTWRKDHLLYGSEGERAFDRWTEWTARHSATYRLGDTPRKVADTFWRIVREADRTPVVTGGFPMTGDEIRLTMRGYFFFKKQAAENVAMLRDAAAGKPTKGFEENKAETGDEEMSQFWMIHCGDANWPRNPETYRKDAIRDTSRQPLYGDHSANITPCAFWDRAEEDATRVRNDVPALILQNEWDYATPLVGARELRKDLRDSRLVVVDEGEGHGVYGMAKNPCVDRVTTEYLLEGRSPTADVTCAAARTAKGPEAERAPGAPLPRLR